MNNPKSITVLITRPKHQAELLCHLITQENDHVFLFPTLEILPSPNLEKLQQQIKQLDQYDYVIFTSANAVSHTSKIIKHYWAELPKHTQVIAIGDATVQALQHAAIPVSLIPESSNSEGILQLPQLDNVKDKNILLFSGVGGRDLLLTELPKRGARIDKAECYQRGKPKVATTKLEEQWSMNKINIVVCTSNEGLVNLYEMLSPKGQQLLCQTPLVVISERMLAKAKELGIKTVLCAQKATNTDIIKTIQAWKEDHD